MLPSCAAPQINTSLADFTLTPEERCQEARQFAEGLASSDPEGDGGWWALAALACAEARLGG